MHSFPPRAYRDNSPSNIFVIEQSGHRSLYWFSIFIFAQDDVKAQLVIIVKSAKRFIEIRSLGRYRLSPGQFEKLFNLLLLFQLCNIFRQVVIRVVALSQML